MTVKSLILAIIVAASAALPLWVAAISYCYPWGCVAYYEHGDVGNEYIDTNSTLQAFLDRFDEAWIRTGRGAATYNELGQIVGLSCFNGSYVSLAYSPPHMPPPPPPPRPEIPFNCNPHFSCVSLGSGRYQLSRTDRSCVSTAMATCDLDQSCDNVAGRCVAYAIDFVDFLTIGDSASSVGGRSVDALGSGLKMSGHLTALPKLVQAGQSARLFWNTVHAKSCTVSTGGTVLSTATSSGATGFISPPLRTRTEYTLHCLGLDGAEPPEVTETQVVNLVPIFQEI